MSFVVVVAGKPWGIASVHFVCVMGYVSFGGLPMCILYVFYMRMYALLWRLPDCILYMFYVGISSLGPFSQTSYFTTYYFAGLHGTVAQSKARSSQIKPDRPKSVHIRPDQTKQTRPSQIQAYPSKSTQIKPHWHSL